MRSEAEVTAIMQGGHAPEDLLADPDRLLAERDRIVAGGEHLHGPEIAARLGVPEAAVMASRVGRDALRLDVNLPSLIAPLVDWSKVLVAIRSAYGVALAIGRFAYAGATGSRVHARSAEHRVDVDAAAACAVFLLREEDMHGKSVSLNAFDAAGDALLRIYLMSKDGRDRAVPHLESFVARDGSRLWCPSLQTGCNRVPEMPTSPRAPQTEERARAALRRAVLALPQAPTLGVCIETPVAQLVSTASFAQSSGDGDAVHASCSALKLHLRSRAAAWLFESDATYGLALCIRAQNGDLFRLAAASAEDAARFDRWRGEIVAACHPQSPPEEAP